MGHIKTNKTLSTSNWDTHPLEVFQYLLPSINRSQTSSSFFKNNLFLGLNSVISLQSLPRTTLFELIYRVYAVNKFSKHRHGTTRAVWIFPGCMEFPRLYGGLQTGFEPIKFLDTRSVWVGHVIKQVINWLGNIRGLRQNIMLHDKMLL